MHVEQSTIFVRKHTGKFLKSKSLLWKVGHHPDLFAHGHEKIVLPTKGNIDAHGYEKLLLMKGNACDNESIVCVEMVDFATGQNCPFSC